jgi:hypothetical protein
MWSSTPLEDQARRWFLTGELLVIVAAGALLAGTRRARRARSRAMLALVAGTALNGAATLAAYESARRRQLAP